MRYVYIKSEPQLYTVGFYKPSGEWMPESDHQQREAAAKRVAYLNGTSLSDREYKLAGALQQLITAVDTLVEAEDNSASAVFDALLSVRTASEAARSAIQSTLDTGE